MLDSPILIISRLLVSGFKTQTSTTGPVDTMGDHINIKINGP